MNVRLTRQTMLAVTLMFLASLTIEFQGCASAPPPAPPVKVEIRPASPGPHAAWVPGHWKWKGKRRGYDWVPGHWKVR